jgi:dTDP-glucose 4,6-dehydratase
MTKRVLITGGAGFVGHHVIDLFLKKTDWEIISLDRLDYSGNLNRLHDVISKYPKADQKRVKIVWHDLKAEIRELTSNFIGKNINIILHLAASSHVDRSITNPMEFLLDNTLGTVNLLDYARGLDSLERLVYFSTDEIFGAAPPGVLYKEYDRYNSTNPYSASKAAAEEFCVAYENTYKLPIFVSHTMNIFGERQHPEKFIPMCIRKIRDSEKIYVHSDPSRTKAGSRFYISAKDVAESMMFLLNLNSNQYKIIQDHMDSLGVRCPKFNIVGKEEIDNLSMVKILAEAQGKEPVYEMVDFHTSRPGHDLRYSLDGSFMRKLGWEPKVTLKQRLFEVSEWSLKNKEWIEL